MKLIRLLVIAATLMLAAAAAPAQTTPAQTANSRSPSLADTLKWLIDFVPSHTGAVYGMRHPANSTQRDTTWLQFNDCDARIRRQ